MAKRPRELGDFKGVGQFDVEGFTFRANIYEPLDRGMVIL